MEKARKCLYKQKNIYKYIELIFITIVENILKFESSKLSN